MNKKFKNNVHARCPFCNCSALKEMFGRDKVQVSFCTCVIRRCILSKILITFLLSLRQYLWVDFCLHYAYEIV